MIVDIHNSATSVSANFMIFQRNVMMALQHMLELLPLPSPSTATQSSSYLMTLFPLLRLLAFT